MSRRLSKIGEAILCSVDELVVLAEAASDTFVFDHVEALDHRPTSREELCMRMQRRP